MSRLKKWFALIAIATLLLVGSVGSQSAFAASGGGCRGDAKISSCISYSGTGGSRNVIADFYMNAYYDPSVYYAYMEVITTNNGTSWYGPYTLDHNGHFGPVSKNVLTLPASSGSAITRVHLYTINWDPHYNVDSWRVSYP